MSNLWLGRFVEPDVINDTSAFRVVGCRDASTGERFTVVAAEPRADRLEAQVRALDRLFEAHHDPAHPVIARAVERGVHESQAWVAFDFPARLDFDQLLLIGLEAGMRASYGEGDGFSLTLRDAILASRARLGVFCHGNVLFAADGRHVVIGFGHNVCVHDEQGRIVVRRRFFQAPEIAVGGEPTASSDFVSMVAMTRGIMPLVRVKDGIARVLAGNSLREDAELVRHMLWFESRVMASPSLRPPLDEIFAVSNRIRALVGSVPDPEGFRELIARLLASERPDLAGGGRTLEVARDGSWFASPGSARADLSKNKLLGRFLRVLAEQRRDAPGKSLSVDALIEAGWPGEKMQRGAGQNRVYVAVAALRKSGLGDALEREDGGYRLSAGTLVRFVDP